MQGAENDLLERIARDERFRAVHRHISAMLDPKLYVGRAPEQVSEFVAEYVDPILARHADETEVRSKATVEV